MNRKFYPVIGLFLLFSFILRGNSPYAAKEDYTSQYKFKLYMARGALSFSEGYYTTAIKNFKKAMEINPASVDARDRYSQAVFFKKVGVLMESTSSG